MELPYYDSNNIVLLESRFGTHDDDIIIEIRDTWRSLRPSCSGCSFRAGRTGGTFCTSWSRRPLGTGIALQTLGTGKFSWSRQSIGH